MHFEPINGHLVSSETFEYSEDTLAHRAFIKVYNTQGKPFKRITKEYDELGYLKALTKIKREDKLGKLGF